MIENLFSTLTDIISAFGTMLGSLFQNIVNLIYDTSTDGGGLTAFGTIVLIGLGTGLVLWGIKFILSYIKVGK